MRVEDVPESPCELQKFGGYQMHRVQCSRPTRFRGGMGEAAINPQSGLRRSYWSIWNGPTA